MNLISMKNEHIIRCKFTTNNVLMFKLVNENKMINES